MAKRQPHDPSVFLTREQKIKVIQTTFPEMRSLVLKKAEMHAEHIKPVQEAFTKLGRRLKADTGVERADWWPDFLKYMRDHDSQDMDSKADTDRIQNSLRLMHDALALGEMVNFLDVLDKEPSIAADADDDGDFGDDVEMAESDLGVAGDDDGAAGGPAPLTANEPKAKEPVEAADNPDADWGENDAPVPAEQDSGADAGTAYNLGEQAGLDGRTDAKALVKAQGWHHKSLMAKNFTAGHAKGLKRRQQLQAEQQQAPAPEPEAPKVTALFDEGDDTVVAFERPPVARVSDGVAASSGDAA